MINHIWTVVCSQVVVDNQTNNVSIYNVLERITIMGEPKQETALPLNHAVVTMWERLDSDTIRKGMMRLSFITPLGNEIIKIESEINLAEHTRFRNISNIQGLPIAESGRHVYRVELRNENESEWTHICDIPIELKFREPEKPEDMVDDQ